MHPYQENHRLEPDQPTLAAEGAETGPEVVPGDELGPQTGPLRLCAVSRVQRPVDEMVRFAAGPDGIIVPDLACRLPGRGVWVELHRPRLEEAIRRNVFAKSLKRAITVPPGLLASIETLVLKRVLERLALANKAGLVASGFAQVDAALEKGTIAALFHGSDAASGGCDKLNRKFAAIAAANGVDAIVVTELTIDQMSLAIGRSNVVHTALMSGGATTRLLEEAKRLTRFRASSAAS